MAEAEPAHRSRFLPIDRLLKAGGQIPLARTLNKECAERVTPIQFSRAEAAVPLRRAFPLVSRSADSSDRFAVVNFVFFEVFAGLSGTNEKKQPVLLLALPLVRSLQRSLFSWPRVAAGANR